MRLGPVLALACFHGEVDVQAGGGGPIASETLKAGVAAVLARDLLIFPVNSPEVNGDLGMILA